MDNLIECRLKSCSGEDYLVPVELLDEFDRLARLLEVESYSYEYYHACKNFDDTFGIYNLEGKLYGDTPLFVTKETFE